MARPIRVVIGDDHAVVREGLKSVLAADDMEVVAEAANGEAVLEAVRRTRPDVVLMDVQMPGMDGVAAARNILSEAPDVKILVLTTYTDEKTVTACLKAGVHGFVVKDVEMGELKRHIRAVVRGEAVLDPKVTGLLMARVRGGAKSPDEEGPEVLTQQQLAILRLVAQGFSNRAIGEKLNLSENTVKGYVAEILHRLGAKNRVEAAMKASSKGWL